MPRPVLHLVAALLGLTALASFAMGIINAPEHGGRLPGQRAPGDTGPAQAIDAPEATPLSQERIEGPPPVEKPAANKTDEADEAAAATNTTAGRGPLLDVPPMATNTAPPETAAPAPSPDDEPPH
jgi:hypothetical protein